jgi:hypothetical protein
VSTALALLNPSHARSESKVLRKALCGDDLLSIESNTYPAAYPRADLLAARTHTSAVAPDFRHRNSKARDLGLGPSVRSLRIDFPGSKPKGGKSP